MKDDRLSHVMEQRAFMIGSELQRIGPFERVAATMPYIVQNKETKSWSYHWDMMRLEHGQLPPPHKAAWEIFAKAIFPTNPPE